MTADTVYWLFVQQSAWISGAISVLMTWKMGSKVWWAPFLGLVGQVFWALLAWFTNQPGLMVTVAVYTFVHARNARKWWVEHFVGLVVVCATKDDVHTAERLGRFVRSERRG